MKLILKDVGKSLTLEDCILFHEKLPLACAWNDGNDLTFIIEKEPTSTPAE